MIFKVGGTRPPRNIRPCGKIALSSLPFDRFIPYQSKLNHTVEISVSVKAVCLDALHFHLVLTCITCCEHTRLDLL